MPCRASVRRPVRPGSGPIEMLVVTLQLHEHLLLVVEASSILYPVGEHRIVEPLAGFERLLHRSRLRCSRMDAKLVGQLLPVFHIMYVMIRI